MAKRKERSLGKRAWAKAVKACVAALTGAQESGSALHAEDFWAAAERGAGEKIPGGDHVRIINGAHAVLDKQNGLVYLEEHAPDELKKKPRQKAVLPIQPEPAPAQPVPGVKGEPTKIEVIGNLVVQVDTEGGGNIEVPAKRVVVNILPPAIVLLALASGAVWLLNLLTT